MLRPLCLFSLLVCVSVVSGPRVLASGQEPRQFVHPGLLHSEADFIRMREKVAQGVEPWKSGWEKLLSSPLKLEHWKPRPVEVVRRGGEGDNVARLYRDVHAAYQAALRWKVGGDEASGRKALEILNAWSATLKVVSGNNDRFLASGIYGWQLANAGEVMRDHPGWRPEEFRRFQEMMLGAFYSRNHDFLVRHNGAAITNYFANWDLCNIASMLAIGVLCDRRDIYEEAVRYYRHGPGNGAADRMVCFLHPGLLGQWQESGRDQGHTIMGVGLAAAICEMAWKQGDDLYAHNHHRLLSGAEYVARYNLGLDVPYRTYAWGVGPKGRRSEAPVISGDIRGQLRPVWEMIYHHHVNRLGMAAPYTAMMVAKVRPEGGPDRHGSTYDQFGFGTLTFTLEPHAGPTRPTGLVAWRRGDAVQLSWRGAAGAVTHEVSRAGSPRGAYDIVAREVRDTFSFAEPGPARGSRWYRVCGVMPDGSRTASSEAVEVAAEPPLLVQEDFEEGGGTPSRGRGRVVPGRSGHVLQLNGKDEARSLPGEALAALTDFTVAAWVHPDQVTPGMRIFDFGGTPGAGMSLSVKGGRGVRFTASTVYHYDELVLESAQPLPPGQWSHVAVTLSDQLLTLYVDGVPVASHDAMDMPPVQMGSMVKNWLGRSQPGLTGWLAGKVDDFRIYGGALSADRVAALAGREPGAPGGT